MLCRLHIKGLVTSIRFRGLLALWLTFSTQSANFFRILLQLMLLANSMLKWALHSAHCTHSNENEQKSELTSTQWPMININFHIPERCSLLKCIPRLRFCYSRNCVCFSSVTFIGQSKLYNGWKFSTNSNKTRWERFKHSVVSRLLQFRIRKLKVKDSLVALHFHLNHKLKLAYGKTSFCERNKQHFMRLVGEGNEQVSEMDRVIEKCTIRNEKAPTNANNS